MTDKKKKGFWRTLGRRDPSSRHSMIEASSQYSLTDSSDDLRSARKTREVASTGSLDRLTTKPPKSGLFKLKPKTPAFWKPLFRRSSSPSTPPSPVNVISTPYRHQLVQTDTPTIVSTSDFGVQAVIVERVTHTRDVLVQTCPAWDDRPGSASGRLYPKGNLVESQADFSPPPAIQHSTESILDISLETPGLTSDPECPQLPTLEIPEQIATNNADTVTMSEILSTNEEFDDSEWKSFCENFPEFQSSLQKDVEHKNNTEISKLGENPFASVKFDFEELRSDFDVLPSTVTIENTCQDFDTLVAGKCSSLPISANQDFDVLVAGKCPSLPITAKIENTSACEDFDVLVAGKCTSLPITAKIENTSTCPDFDVLVAGKCPSLPITAKIENTSTCQDFDPLVAGKCHPLPITAKIENTSCPDFDTLREEKCPSLPDVVDKLPLITDRTDVRNNYRLDKYRKTSASPESAVIRFQEDEFRPRSSEPIRDLDHTCLLNSCNSSTRNSMGSGIDALLQPDITKFDSCDNLEQLENEIIRALYSPVLECDSSHLDVDIQKTIYIRDNFKGATLNLIESPIYTSDSQVTVEVIDTEKDSDKEISSKMEDEPLLYESGLSKPWLSLGVPLENITEESATDDESNSQNEYPNNDANLTLPYKSNSADDQKLAILADYPAAVSPGVAAVNEVSEVFVELPPRKAKICLDVRELAKISRARANSHDSIETDLPYEGAKTDFYHDLEIERPEQTSMLNFDMESTTRGMTPEKLHVSHSYITLKQQDGLTSVDPDSNLIPPPPPPPPPPSSALNRCSEKHLSANHSEAGTPSPAPANKSPSPNTAGKSAMVFELEQKFLTRQKMADDLEGITKRIAMDAQKDTNGLFNNSNGHMNGQNFQNQNGYQNGHREHRSPSPTTLSVSKSPVSYQYITKGQNPVSFDAKTVITDQPPPPGAVLIDEKVTVEGDKVHRDKYFALPVKEVLKERTSTTKFIPAPSRYEGIGPTEDGVPLGLRQSVKKENMSDWYKTMYKTLHKIENEDDHYVIGYTSDPEVKREGRKSPRKLDIMSEDHHQENIPNGSVYVHAYPASAKSTLNPYSSHPRPIADYQPGYSSSADDQPNLVSKRHFPTVSQAKPSYEIKDGFESEDYVLKRNLCIEPEAEIQKVWYRQVQQGGDIPQFGLGKPAPEKPISPVVGPAPPQQHTQSNGSYTYPKAVSRPDTLPPENGVNGNGHYSAYADHMRQALHHELHQKNYQISSPNGKSPRKMSLEKRLLGRALYNFAAESPREISLKKGDVVIIHRELDKNWYEGEHNAAMGIFPVSYVEVLPPEHSSSPQPPKSQEGIGRVLYDFTAHTSVELQARKGDDIQLIRKVDDNWFEGRINGKKGIIPASYVSVIENPAPALSPKRYTVSPPKSSPRLLEISGSTPISPVSSTTLSSPSLTSGHHEPVSNGNRRVTKKGNKLIEPVPYRALYRYSPQNADELELLDGDTVYVVEMCDDGWYVGTSVRTGELGIIPGNYMEKVC